MGEWVHGKELQRPAIPFFPEGGERAGPDIEQPQRGSDWLGTDQALVFILEFGLWIEPALIRRPPRWLTTKFSPTP